MLGNCPDQFKDLTLNKDGPQVEGIQGGLVIEGTGTFNFHIEDNKRAVLPLALIIFKVGCHVESSMRCLKTALTIKRLPHLVAFAAAGKAPYHVPTICFDMDFFSIGVNTFTLVTMGNRLEQFEDLTLNKDGPQVERIQGGLVIKGQQAPSIFTLKTMREHCITLKSPTANTCLV